jgi:uncharacterized membrane protein YeaQ/YmgE (transglycosylase-associated protein family)
MGIIMWIIFGALAGWIASMIMKTNEEQGAVANIVIGIIGAVIGGFIFNLLGGSSVDGFNIYSLIVAIVGAVILIAILKAFRKS